MVPCSFAVGHNGDRTRHLVQLRARNWDTDAGCPSFVVEEPGDEVKENPRALTDIQAYVRNAALWLAGRRNR